MAFQIIDPKAMTANPFALIGDQWMLVTAGKPGKVNTMTASWGGLGVLWGRPVATIYIRPSRYTYGFLEQEGVFTLSFLPESQREALRLCGSKSGRDIDKVKACGFTPIEDETGAVYFEQAELVLVCKKLYYQDILPEHFLDPSIAKDYPNGDYHRLYIGEILRVLEKK